MKWAVGALAIVAVLGGCGGSHHADSSAIRAALVSSPVSYLHYTAPVWWGRPVHPRLVSVSASGKFAVAHVVLPSGPRSWRSQWALLSSTGSRWRVRGVALGRARNLPCAAGRAVMKSLAGGCASFPDSVGGTIVGPEDSRPASPAEQAAIEEVGRRRFDPGHNSCVQYVIRVSKLDLRYARVGYRFHKPFTNCDLFNGEDVYFRGKGGWHSIAAASEPFPCSYRMPPGIARSLFGVCWIESP